MSDDRRTAIAAVRIPVSAGFIDDQTAVVCIWRFQVLYDDMDDQDVAYLLAGVPVGTCLVVYPDTSWWQTTSSGEGRIWERGGGGGVPDEIATTAQLVASLSRPRRRGLWGWLRGGRR